MSDAKAELHPDVPVSLQRMLLRPWLETHLEAGDIPGLEWVDKEKTLFRIPWKHRSKGNWSKRHGAVFVVCSNFHQVCMHPPTLVAGGIMSGCLSVCPSVYNKVFFRLYLLTELKDFNQNVHNNSTILE